MNEPLVRIVSVKCQECGEDLDTGEDEDGTIISVPFVRPISWLRDLRGAATIEHDSGCGGRVLIATEPVQQGVGE